MDRFTYSIVTENANGIISVSTAEVTIALGNQNANSQVAFDFELVSGDGSGTAINPNGGVKVGDRFGVEIYVEDLRAQPTYVFAGFLDLLYDTQWITPSDADAGNAPGFDFAVDFGPGYLADAGVGTAVRPGIIDEFGTLYSGSSTPGNPALLATIYFDAVSAGTANVIGSPADLSPFQDTLLFGVDNPIDRSLLRFETLQITVASATPLQNPSLAQDVNNDGSVSPIDALVVINQVSRAASLGEGEFAATGVTASQFFTDVNGDNTTSALDALQVINYLAKMNGSQASGEQIAVLSAPASSNSSTPETADDVFAALGGDDAEKLVSTAATAPVGVAQVSLASIGGADDDDEDDVLTLLADDVTGIWS